jgi:stearoyl-CoA desaturase (delta-9 desaturase)
MPPQLADLLAFGLTGSPWLLVLLFVLLTTQLTVLSVTLYLHRSQAHRAVDFHPALAHLFRFWTWLTTAMVTREWVAIHRKHHAKCETAEDPHSPVHLGIRNVLWRGADIYRASCADRAMVEQYGIGCPDDWVERNVYARYSWLGPTLMMIIDLALFGAVGIAIWAVQMMWIPIWAAGVINGLGHWWGYRNYETSDRSTNLTPIAFWMGGEELHNNHHAFPSSAKFSLARYEFDIGWAALKVLERLRLASVLRMAPGLEVREAVAAPDAETLRALLTHKAGVMTAYFRSVIVPALREEAEHARDSMHKLTRRIRRALKNDGRWLDLGSRERLQRFVGERPRLQHALEYRRRLAEVLERSGKRSEEMLEGLRAWCHDAEQSGVAALENFARRLRGYALVPARS